MDRPKPVGRDHLGRPPSRSPSPIPVSLAGPSCHDGARPRRAETAVAARLHTSSRLAGLFALPPNHETCGEVALRLPPNHGGTIPK